MRVLAACDGLKQDVPVSDEELGIMLVSNQVGGDHADLSSAAPVPGTHARRKESACGIPPDPHRRNAAEWIGRLKLTERLLSTFTPSKPPFRFRPKIAPLASRPSPPFALVDAALQTSSSRSSSRLRWRCIGRPPAHPSVRREVPLDQRASG